ncbi:MAG TPA: hypothetical protein VLS93_06815 [Anaeromyxobacteraceae bacterium]|nr:hypothetical protein [Anaeromyxobacteraceae bacterium]
MTPLLSAAAALAAAAILEVPAGEPLAAALARARPGDVVRLGPGDHAGSLGRLDGIRVEGAGPAATRVLSPEGEDGAVVVGRAEISGLAIRAGPARSAVKVLGGTARLSDVALRGGASGAFVDGGRLDGEGVDLVGGHYGLLSARGQVALRGGSARGGMAGVGILGGALDLSRFAVVGPSREAGISVSGGRARLSAVTVRAPGPTGIAVDRGTVEGEDVLVAGAVEQDGFLGDCLMARRGTVRLAASTFLGCAGTALSASGGEVRLSGVDAVCGASGCLVFVNDARADLEGGLCAGRGPALVAGSGAQVRTRFERWRTDPTVWVDCGAGARVRILDGGARQPCPGSP